MIGISEHLQKCSCRESLPTNYLKHVRYILIRGEPFRKEPKPVQRPRVIIYNLLRAQCGFLFCALPTDLEANQDRKAQCFLAYLQDFPRNNRREPKFSQPKYPRQSKQLFCRFHSRKRIGPKSSANLPDFCTSPSARFAAH